MTQTQKTYEKILEIGTLILVVWHMLMTFGKYFCSAYKAEMIYAAILSFAAVIYLILCRCKWPETQYRIKDFIKKLLSPCQIFCFVLLFWSILSFFVNGTPYFVDNLWLIFDMAINCLILFNLPMVLSQDKVKKIIDLLLHIVSFVGTGIAVFGLWHLFTLDFITLETGEIIGMVRHSFQLGCYYNLTAAIALSFILIALYMISSQKIPVKIIYTVNLIIHTLVLLLTNSRAAFVACIFAYFAAMYLVVWNLPAQRSIPLRFLTSLAASALTAGIIWMMRTWAFQLFEAVTHYSNPLTAKIIPSVLHSGSLSEPDDISSCLTLFALPVFLSREKIKSCLRKVNQVLSRTAKIALAVSFLMILCTVTTCVSPIHIEDCMLKAQLNIAFAEGDTKSAAQAGEEALRDLNDLGTIKAREQIWKKTIAVIQSDWRTFLFGVTPMAAQDALAEFRITHAHNQILQIGLILGAPMMILFSVFLVIIGVKSVRLAFKDGTSFFPGAGILSVVFFSLVVLTMVESYLVATFSIMSSLFFLFCGWINALKVNSADEKEHFRQEQNQQCT